MFIHSSKALEIIEGEQRVQIPAGFVGEVPDWAGKHWFFIAALKDGTITAPDIQDKTARKKAIEQAV